MQAPKLRTTTLLYGVGAAALASVIVWRVRNPSLSLFSLGTPSPASKASPSLPGGPLPAGTTGLTSYLSDAFFREVESLAAHMRSRGASVTGEDLLAVFLAESGVGPHIKNRIGCAGLNQICDLEGVGWTGSLEQYLSLPGEQQLTFVRRYFDNVNRYPGIRDFGDLYLVNFSPAFLGAPPSDPIWRGRHPVMYVDPERGGGGGLDRNYTGNAGVDTGNKGFIEIADMAKFVARSVANNSAKWNELRMRLQRANAGIA